MLKQAQQDQLQDDFIKKLKKRMVIGDAGFTEEPGTYSILLSTGNMQRYRSQS